VKYCGKYRRRTAWYCVVNSQFDQQIPEGEPERPFTLSVLRLN